MRVLTFLFLLLAAAAISCAALAVSSGCPTGTYDPGTSVCQSCPVCETGHYLTGCSGTSPGQCEPCTICTDPGTVTTRCGGTTGPGTCQCNDQGGTDSGVCGVSKSTYGKLSDPMTIAYIAIGAAVFLLLVAFLWYCLCCGCCRCRRDENAKDHTLNITVTSPTIYDPQGAANELVAMEQVTQYLNDDEQFYEVAMEQVTQYLNDDEQFYEVAMEQVTQYLNDGEQFSETGQIYEHETESEDDNISDGYSRVGEIYTDQYKGLVLNTLLNDNDAKSMPNGGNRSHSVLSETSQHVDETARPPLPAPRKNMSTGSM